jgi:hypothetical protein|nr:hypothetical protein [Neorhizobium tomejilense]
MRLTVPYIFEGGLTYSRNRKDELSGYHFQDIHFATAEIDIPVVSGVDAPLAVEASILVEGGKPWRDVGFRFYDGRFYTTDSVSPDGPGLQVKAEMLSKGAWPYSGYDRHPVAIAYATTPRLFGWSGAGSVIKTMLGGWEPVIPKATVQWERRDACREAAMEALSSLLIVEGEVWRAVHEPKLVVHARSPGMLRQAVIASLSIESCMGVPAFTNDRSGLSISPTEFRAFQMGDVDKAAEYAEGFQDIGPLQFAVRDIRVHMPEVLKTDSGLVHLAKTASDFLVKTSGTLHAAPDKDVVAWLALREQLERAQNGVGDEQELARCIAEAIRGAWIKPAVRAAAAAMEVYDELPVSLQTAVGQALHLR